jgi:lysophospholipase L1-like esterase
MQLPAKTSLTVLAFVVMVAIPYYVPVPVIRDYRPLDPRGVVSVLDLPLPKTPVVDAVNPLASPASVAELGSKRLVHAAPNNLVDPTHELDHFYKALLKGEVTRIAHYGDSPTTADLITADARAMLQKEFGNAGSGFVLVARPWAWYNHRGVGMEASNWQIDIAGNTPLKDGLYGLGAVSFRGQPGAIAHWNLRDATHTSAEIYYLRQPYGGQFVLEAEAKPIGMASAAADEVAPGFARFDIPPGASHFTLKVINGNVRIYGVDFRTSNPGVVYSSIGVNGANVTLLSRAFNSAHWAAELRHYNPDLVVIDYGTNESGFPDFVDQTWGNELRRAVARVHAALPETSILLMSPMDRGERKSTGEIETIASMPRLVDTEARIALDTGVAFFNTFEAMGGQGTMARWYSSEPRLVGADYIHPMPAGAKIVGELLYSALHDGFKQYKVQTMKERLALTPPGAEASPQP